MRALPFLLAVVLAGCANTPTIYSTSQRQILKQSQEEIARREPWAGTAAIFVTNPGEISRLTWKVRAGAYDFSDYPNYRGINFIPGTERELRFTANGCLTSYTDRGNHCLTGGAADSAEIPMFPGK